MASWTDRPGVVTLRQRFAAVDVGAGTLDIYRRRQSGRSAAAIAYFGFLSLFPLLLALTTILGFLLEDNEELQQEIIDGALSQIPIIGPQLTADPASLTGSVPVLIFGLLTSVWSGQRAFVGMQAALDDLAEVGIDERANLAVTRLRALIGIVVVALTQILTAVLQTRVAVVSSGVPMRLMQVVATLAVNFLGLSAVYRWLCQRRLTWAAVRPGAVFGAIGFTVLQLVGVAVVGRSIARASEVYGTFATVIALLFWLSLHSTITLYGAALNQAITERADRDQLTPAPSPDAGT
jgi:membrane protein